jgi:hypothetical protein
MREIKFKLFLIFHQRLITFAFFSLLELRYFFSFAIFNSKALDERFFASLYAFQYVMNSEPVNFSTSMYTFFFDNFAVVIMWGLIYSFTIACLWWAKKNQIYVLSNFYVSIASSNSNTLFFATILLHQCQMKEITNFRQTFSTHISFAINRSLCDIQAKEFMFLYLSHDISLNPHFFAHKLFEAAECDFLSLSILHELFTHIAHRECLFQ